MVSFLIIDIYDTFTLEYLKNFLHHHVIFNTYFVLWYIFSLLIFLIHLSLEYFLNVLYLSNISIISIVYGRWPYTHPTWWVGVSTAPLSSEWVPQWRKRSAMDSTSSARPVGTGTTGNTGPPHRKQQPSSHVSHPKNQQGFQAPSLRQVEVQGLGSHTWVGGETSL